MVRTVQLTKTYPDGTHALNGVDVAVSKGEIHGLLGENGAGKTTLSKILSGMLHPTSGEVYIKGEKVNYVRAQKSAGAGGGASISRPKDALALGIGMVHQHFTLVRPFTAFENIVLGTRVNPTGSSAGAVKEELMGLSKDVGLQVSLDLPVESMALGAQQRVEILKMLYRKVDILILDEPTSSLSLKETDELFRALGRLKEEGKCVIFITHKLKEVIDICDTITVLRQGKVTGRISKAEATPKVLARMMVGRDVEFELKKSPMNPGEPILSVEGLAVSGRHNAEVVKDVSFTVRQGEIFGIAGVEGNGQTELVEAICGTRPVAKGSIRLRKVDLTGQSTATIRKQSVGLIPEDRRQSGLVLEMNLAENVILGKQRNAQFKGTGPAIAWKKVVAFTVDLMKRFEIVAQGPEASAKSLSGGNQQKVVVSRELSGNPDFILASQPTRGLDVAATEYIRKLLLDARGAGKGVLLVSADLDEIVQLSDVIGVIYGGRLLEVGPAEKMSRERIGLLMGGIKE
ncbi:MAG: ABC transporter ATP-binding protein [Nitrososphaerales archaeon]|nr:ABC transporter ATP-binding protein [Nitrososphaerales archaeon]